MSDYRVQINPTIGGVLFNINGEDAEEVLKNLAVLAANAPDIYNNLIAIQQGHLATQALNPNVTPADVPFTPDVPKNVATPPPSNSPVPKCKCGVVMNDVRGKTYQSGDKKGQPYPNSFYAAKDCTAKCPAIK